MDRRRVDRDKDVPSQYSHAYPLSRCGGTVDRTGGGNKDMAWQYVPCLTMPTFK